MLVSVGWLCWSRLEVHSNLIMYESATETGYGLYNMGIPSHRTQCCRDWPESSS